MYIVQGEEAQPEYLVRDEEVPDVGSAESRAGGAIAIGVERLGIGAELGALDIEAPVPREDRPVPPHPGRRHAIEQIDPATYRFYQILGEADSHEIAGVGLR